MRWMLAALALVPAHALAKSETMGEQLDRLVHRTPAEIEPLISVKGDSLDPSITVSSYGATQFVNKGWLASTTTENSFLRGFIDRKSGTVTAQIYYIANYGGSGWNFFNRATYESTSGLQEVEVDKIGSDVDCQRYGCYYTEQVGITVPFATLEAIAAKWSPQTAFTGLKYRLFGKSGQTIDDAVPINEITAFVNVVHRNGGRSTAVSEQAEAPPPKIAPPAPAPAKAPASRPAGAQVAKPVAPHVRCVTC